MHPLSTDAYPYTITYVCELLGLDEPRVLAMSKAVGVQPHRDIATGRIQFSVQDLEQLRKATMPDARNPLVANTPSAMTPGKAAYASVPQRAATGGGMSRGEISVIVDAVSNAKEGILRDLSQLLDDKLAGLDEVVVELIRSKSENDTLRDEIKRLAESRDHLQMELARFKPAAFGFYRKEG